MSGIAPHFAPLSAAPGLAGLAAAFAPGTAMLPQPAALPALPIPNRKTLPKA